MEIWYISDKGVFWKVKKGYIASLEHSYLSLYFVCQLYNWSYSLKLRFFPCAILFQQSHITKHTSVSSPRKTLITTTLSTKCLSYCNISKPSHTCMPKWRPVFFLWAFQFLFCRDLDCTMYEKKICISAHWFLSLSQIETLSESRYVLLWGSGDSFLGVIFSFIFISTNVCLVFKSRASKNSCALEKNCRHIKLLTLILWQSSILSLFLSHKVVFKRNFCD